MAERMDREGSGSGPSGPSVPGGSAGGLRAVESRLGAVRSRARWMLILGAGAVLGSALIASVLSLGVVDYLLRLPAWLRAAIWVIGVVALGVAAWRRMSPALRFRPSLTDIALRLERSEEGQRAGLGGVLASGLELARDQAQGATAWMADHVVSEAGSKFAAVRATSLIKPARTVQSLLALGACALGCLAVAALVGERLSEIGAERVLAPWSGVQWPKRTELADATADAAHPLNRALPLRAALKRTESAVGQTKVWANYRIVGEKASPRRVQLTGQSRRSMLDLADGSKAEGELYERLIEPASLGLALNPSGAPPGPPAELEYWLQTQDDQTEPRRIKLVQPPSIVSAAARITPPPYAVAPGGGGAKGVFASGALDLGPGNDQRAVIGPVLAGSHIELTIRLNKPVPTPPARHDEESAAARRVWLASALPGADFGDDFALGFQGAQWTLGWIAASSARLAVVPVDEFGLRSPEEAAYSIDVVPDRAPTAAVIEPREDESVLATAVIPVTGEGRDDVGIASVSLSRQLARASKGSIGAAPEPVEPPVTIASRDLVSAPEPGGVVTQAAVSLNLELSTLDLKPGEELLLAAVVSDNYEISGERHEPVRSTPRRLRIIREDELIDQLRAELGAVRKVAMRLDEDQSDLQKPVARGAVSTDDRHRQSGLSQRIAQQSESVKRLSDRAERNQVKDDAIKGLLSDVDSVLKDAAAASERASAQLDQAAQQSPDPDRAELSKEQQDAASKEQEAVRDNLGRLAEMLDKGEDSWLVSRTLQRLAQQQRDLKAQTERAGEQTMGKKAQDLTPQERSQLAELAERQQRLAEEARQAMNQLEQRAQQLKDADASQSQAMKQAAQRGREKQVDQKMENAAKDTQQNQTSQASAEQQEAADTLQQMLQDMQEAQKNRDANLRRVLADVLKSLDQLIRDQETQIAALAGAAPTAAYAGLDAPMIQLNQNTVAVADQARSDKQTAHVAETISRAGTNQESAIKSLRASPVGAEDAEQGEKESLRLLTLAKAEAQKLRDEASKRDTQKKRQELRQAYREALEEQAALRADTEPFVGKNIDRKDRIKVRGIGEKQELLRQKLAEVKAKTEELAEAGVFDYAHQRLELAMSTAGKKLRAGQPDKAVSRSQDSSVRILRSLVEALDEQLKRDDEFREANGASGGGGGGGPGAGKPPALPPLAELRLLRAMQAEAAETTRAIDEAKEPAGEELAGLGDLQNNLAKKATELLKKVDKPEAPGLAPGEAPKEQAKPGEGGKPEGPEGGNGG